MADPGVIIPEVNYDDDMGDLEEDDIMEDEEDKPTTSELLENIPAMVSITRVPKNRPPAVQSPGMTGAPHDVKPHVKGGPPPPLLRVGGGPNLPPMPRLRLGGVRGAAPPRAPAPGGFNAPHHHHPAMNGMLNMMQNNMTENMMMGHPAMQPNAGMGGMPIIAGTMSLRGMRPSMPVNRVHPGMRAPQGIRNGMMQQHGMRPGFQQGSKFQRMGGMQQQQQGLRPGMPAVGSTPQVRQKTAFRPANPNSRPVQVFKFKND